MDIPQQESTSPSSPTTANGSFAKPVRRFHQRALIWDLEETRALLDLLKDERILKAIESVRTREIYHEIADRLKQLGFSRDWNQIRGRVKNLKFSYKKARALHEEHGQSTSTCRFYDDLHYLFGHKYKKQRSKKRPLSSPNSSQVKYSKLSSNGNEEGEIVAINRNHQDIDDISDDDDDEARIFLPSSLLFLTQNHLFSLQSINDDDEQHQHSLTSIDENSSEYIQRPEDPYPILQSTRFQTDLTNGISHDEVDHHSNPDEQDSSMINDEMDVYLKSISPYKHQAYLIDDILQSVLNKFLLSQQQSEQRLISFFTEQRREDQLREERIHREQRQHQFELVQFILNQGSSPSNDQFCRVRSDRFRLTL